MYRFSPGYIWLVSWLNRRTPDPGPGSTRPEAADEITLLEVGDSVEFLRDIHVEMFRGGMNRLLLRSRKTDEFRRLEIHFQYVPWMQLPSKFWGLTIENCGRQEDHDAPWFEALLTFDEVQVFRLLSGGQEVAVVLAAACRYGQDDEGHSAQSMFFMM